MSTLVMLGYHEVPLVQAISGLYEPQNRSPPFCKSLSIHSFIIRSCNLRLLLSETIMLQVLYFKKWQQKWTVKN